MLTITVQALSEIQRELSQNDDIISTDPEDLLAHGFSEWDSVRLDTLPVAVAYPQSTADVSAIARICHKWRVPIVPYSGGSSIEGHTSAPFGGISVDFTHMDKMIELHEEDMDVVVQPSVCWVDLNKELERKGTGLFFPIDPGMMKLPN
jgi:D-lactate dehydrogenase (cytochrome)